MNKHGLDHRLFSLQPFLPLADREITLSCKLGRKKDTLSLSYGLAGDISGVDAIGSLADVPGRRRDGLWETTCFECFLQAANCQGYHEVNVAPSGDWNVYAFDSYREGMREERRIGFLDISTRHSADRYSVEFTLSLGEFGLSNRPLRLGLSAVITHTDEGRSYWALCHSGNRPDFHNASCFTVEI